MDRQHIIDQIRRTAENGRAIEQTRFETETGVKQHQWRGKYWANWGDAIKEAGYEPNEWTAAHDESFVLESLLHLTRKLQKYPTKSEMDLERRSDFNFPGSKSIFRVGNKSELIGKLQEYCQSNEAFSDLAAILSQTPANRSREEVTREAGSSTSGYVYLIDAQNAYKIGCTRAPYRRTAEIAIQSANGAKLIHLIETDDPEGIESYWHKRFDQKRSNGINKQSGEWFMLDKDDIKAFKRRRNLM